MGVVKVQATDFPDLGLTEFRLTASGFAFVPLESLTEMTDEEWDDLGDRLLEDLRHEVDTIDKESTNFEWMGRQVSRPDS